MFKWGNVHLTDSLAHHFVPDNLGQTSLCNGFVEETHSVEQLTRNTEDGKGPCFLSFSPGILSVSRSVL